MVDLYTDGGQPMGPPVDIWALGCLIYGVCFFNLPFGTSALAIQTGQYTIPDASQYSVRLHKLISKLESSLSQLYLESSSSSYSLHNGS